jgi:hypothetical protein
MRAGGEWRGEVHMRGALIRRRRPCPAAVLAADLVAELKRLRGLPETPKVVAEIEWIRRRLDEVF